MAQKVQMPARKPPARPQTISVFITHSAGHVEGGSVRNMPRLADMTSEKINVHPKTLSLVTSLYIALGKIVVFHPCPAKQARGVPYPTYDK